MKAPPDAVLEPPAAARAAAPAASPPTRPFRWSVRRELWENRWIYLAPLGVAAFAVVALVIHGVTMPSHLPGMLGNDPAEPGSAPVTYRVPTLLMLATALVVGAFYSLEALNGERRDRSILFWKSLPVSDLTTILAKASVPLLLLPLITFAATVAMHLAMLLLSAAVLLAHGQGPGALWRELQLLRLWPALLYGLVAMTLWHAPLHGALLLVSATARRTAALWAVLPLLAAVALEKVTMDTTRVVSFVVSRLAGWYAAAFAARPETLPFDPAVSLTPGRLLAAPALWIGLALAGAFLAAAARLRRHREPG